MIVECSKEKLREAILKAEKATGKNLTLPALSGIFLEAKKNILTVRATNLDIGIEIKVPAKIEKEGEVLLPATTLSQFLSFQKNESYLRIELKGKVIEWGGKGQKATINSLPHEDFPIIPKVESEEEFEIQSSLLAEALRGVWYASSPQSMKPELSSVFFSGNHNELILVATDSFRLAEKKVKIKNGFSSSFLVPYRNVGEIIRFADSQSGIIKVVKGAHQVSFTLEDTYLVTRTIEGSFPDYQQVIPKEKKSEVILFKEDFASSLKLVQVFADKFSQVTCEISSGEKSFIVRSRNPDVGECEEKVPATIEGESISINYNFRYLYECVQSIHADSLSLTFSGQGKPALIRPVGDTSFLYLIMPMNR